MMYARRENPRRRGTSTRRPHARHCGPSAATGAGATSAHHPRRHVSARAGVGGGARPRAVRSRPAHRRRTGRRPEPAAAPPGHRGRCDHHAAATAHGALAGGVLAAVPGTAGPLVPGTAAKPLRARRRHPDARGGPRPRSRRTALRTGPPATAALPGRGPAPLPAHRSRQRAHGRRVPGGAAVRPGRTGVLDPSGAAAEWSDRHDGQRAAGCGRGGLRPAPLRSARRAAPAASHRSGAGAAGERGARNAVAAGAARETTAALRASVRRVGGARVSPRGTDAGGTRPRVSAAAARSPARTASAVR